MCFQIHTSALTFLYMRFSILQNLYKVNYYLQHFYKNDMHTVMHYGMLGNTET